MQVGARWIVLVPYAVVARVESPTDQLRRAAVIRLRAVLRALGEAACCAETLHTQIIAEREGSQPLRIDRATDPLQHLVNYQAALRRADEVLTRTERILNESLDTAVVRRGHGTPRANHSWQAAQLRILPLPRRASTARELFRHGLELIRESHTVDGDHNDAAWWESLLGVAHLFHERAQRAADAGNHDAGRIQAVAAALQVLARDEVRLRQLATGRDTGITLLIMAHVVAARMVGRQAMLASELQATVGVGATDAAATIVAAAHETCGIFCNGLEGLGTDATLFGSEGQPRSALLARVLCELTTPQRWFIPTGESPPQLATGQNAPRELLVFDGFGAPMARGLCNPHARDSAGWRAAEQQLRRAMSPDDLHRER